MCTSSNRTVRPFGTSRPKNVPSCVPSQSTPTMMVDAKLWMLARRRTSRGNAARKPGPPRARSAAKSPGTKAPSCVTQTPSPASRAKTPKNVRRWCWTTTSRLRHCAIRRGGTERAASTPSFPSPWTMRSAGLSPTSSESHAVARGSMVLAPFAYLMRRLVVTRGRRRAPRARERWKSPGRAR